MITEKDYQSLSLLRKKFVETCTKCDGTGTIEKDGVTKDCICDLLFKWAMQLYLSRIPELYWKFTIDKLKMEDTYALDYVRSVYVANIHKAKDNNIGLFMYGSHGTGKTTLMCLIGKSALIQGYKVKYVLTSELNKAVNDDKINSDGSNTQSIIGNADFILLDEIDKITLTESAINNLLNTVKNNLHRIWIIATNADIDEIEERFGSAFFSLIKRHTRILPVTGKDISTDRQELMDDLLTKKSKHFNGSVVLNEALEFEQYKLEKLKTEFDVIL